MKFSLKGSKHKVVPIFACSHFQCDKQKWNNLVLRTLTAQFQMSVSQKCMEFLAWKQIQSISKSNKYL